MYIRDEKYEDMKTSAPRVHLGKKHATKKPKLTFDLMTSQNSREELLQFPDVPDHRQLIL
ncbi:hypothetical protein EYF80_050841 [Liparis tanakae]|uniref:Uncharacterized protein n=1 Tax=Liparis tanakae TaxID=230148 RepID=A0A4Z2FDD2_9TELE|nr:hypothetical protein EYF80_050841 [Liparis tanakae]